MEGKKLILKNIDISREQIKWVCDRENDSTNSYSNFLITVAGISLGVSPLIFSSGIFTTISFKVKTIFIVSFVSIFISLLFGAINIILEKIFYKKWGMIYKKIFEKWNAASVSEITAEDAQRCEICLYESMKRNSQIWPLILQSIFLFAGFFGIIINIFFILLG